MGHEIKGGKTTAIVYGDYPDNSETGQIYELLDSPAHEGCPIRIMPDHHAGKGCVIGFTSPLKMESLKIIPNLIGVDIGCGIQAVKLEGKLPNKVVSLLPEFDKYLRSKVPSGFSSFEKASKRREWLYHWWFDSKWSDFEDEVENLSKRAGTDSQKVWLSCGTLGGGNHFIEINQGQTDDLYLAVHSGSRNFGLKVATFHQNNAAKIMGRKNGLEWLEGDNAESYLRDMRVAQRFAMLNRLIMLDNLTEFFDLKLKDCEIVTSVHNYIGSDNIIRKGAISANEGETVIIPFNMADGIVIGTGLGNEDWNNSAPHGAGRKMSRSQAKKEIGLGEFKKVMKDANVWSSCISQGTVDESPMAYKDAESILSYISETVSVTDKLKPIYNFKAGGEHV